MRGFLFVVMASIAALVFAGVAVVLHVGVRVRCAVLGPLPPDGSAVLWGCGGGLLVLRW